MAVTLDTSQFDMSRLKVYASKNILDIMLTLDTFHLEMSPLNNVARLNIPDMAVALDTSHFDISPLNNLAFKNMRFMSVMPDTSHFAIGPSAPLAQCPFGSNLRHMPTALLSSSVVVNDAVVVHTVGNFDHADIHI